MAAFTKQEILDQLDAFAGKQEYQFPNLDSAASYPVGARLSAYRDDEHWAILFEDLRYNECGCLHGTIFVRLSPFGNCLRRRPVPHQVDFLKPTSDGPEGPTIVEEDGATHLANMARTIRVHSQLLPVENDPSIYKKHGIPLMDEPKITPLDLLRLMYPRFRDMFYARDETLRNRSTFEMPLVLRLYGWQHPRVMEGELPSQSPSLITIAEILESGRIFDFVDPGIDNVHWSNWPEGGSL